MKTSLTNNLIRSTALALSASYMLTSPLALAAGEKKDDKGFLEKMEQWQDKMSDKFRSQYVFDDSGRIVQYPKGTSTYPTLDSLVTFEYMTLTENQLPRQPIFVRLRTI